MKLRIRHEKKTKTITLQDEPAPTVGTLKQAVEGNVFPEWGLSQGVDFDVSLDGKNSIGVETLSLKDASVVSGDLVKVIFGSVPPPVTNLDTQASTALTSAIQQEHNEIPPSTTSSSTSLNHSDIAGTSAEAIASEIPCSSPGPIFFRECDGVSQVPHAVQMIYENDSIKNEFQALCVVMHFMMCECGFYIDGMNERMDILPLLQQNLFVTEYSHGAGGNLKLSFSCNQLGSFILVNSVVQPCSNIAEQVITLQVVTNEFITQRFNGRNKNSNASAVYKNLSKLNRQVKETIAHPAIGNMRDELCLPPVHGLLALFPEILQYILSFLDCKSLVALGQVNKMLLDITSDDNLWRSLYIRDYKSQPISVGTTWKDLYSRRYKYEKEQRRELQRIQREYENDFTRPHFHTDPTYPQIFPQQPFGMIGGEHDLHPSFPYGPFANPNRRVPPNRPHPLHPDNPVPGSRYDPIYPGGAFRPGRGGGMQDIDDGMGGEFRGLDSDFGLPRPRNTNRPGFSHRFDFI